MSAQRQHHDDNEGRAKPSSHAHPHASMPFAGTLHKSQCCGARGRAGKQSNVCTKNDDRYVDYKDDAYDHAPARRNTTLHATATRMSVGRFGDNSPPPLGRRSGAGKVPACAPHGVVGIERAEATSRRQRGKGESIVARASECVDSVCRPIKQITTLRGTGPRRRAIQCPH